MFSIILNINSEFQPDILTDTLENPMDFQASNELSLIRQEKQSQLYKIPYIIQPGFVPEDDPETAYDESQDVVAPIVGFHTWLTPVLDVQS